jgi:hypothetical protein
MNRLERMSRWGAGLAIGALLLATPATFVRAGGQDTTMTGNPAPTAEQIRLLFTRVVENQHRNDRAIEEFERVEHVVSRKSSDTSDGFTERTERILPSGTGTMKLPMMENGSHVSPEAYRHQLEIAVAALNIAVHPNDRYRQDLAKFEKRRRERAEVVDTSLQAFRATWAGRETRGSRTFAKYILEPNPEYKANTRLATTFEHVRAAIWVDESQAEFSRIEGDITSDITFGGGIVGKVYHGGHFIMEQTEVEPGVWLPTLYTYDVDGRKFMFGFGVHEQTDISHYRRVGPPSQSIELVRNELNNLSAGTPTR